MPGNPRGMGMLSVSRGRNDKPAATDALIDDLRRISAEGHLMAGYPVMASTEGCVAIDALLVSPRLGVVSFDLVEGSDPADFQDRQDTAYSLLQSRLLKHRELRDGRELGVPIESVTYAPAVSSPPDSPEGIIDSSTIGGWIRLRAASPEVAVLTPELHRRALSALQSISSIRRAARSRDTRNPDSKGSVLRRLEDSIATLDAQQSKAVIETVDGVQRIRGLAGSGKTIVLALKAAYLHARYPEWRMAITFNTRSLKQFYSRLVNTFVIEHTGAEPDWDNIRILNAWGAPGAPERDGIYYQFCRANNVEYLDFGSARRKYGYNSAFAGAVGAARGEAGDPNKLYDVFLIDEAQDLPPAFLALCHSSLEDRGLLVYAYDELQNLRSSGLPPPEDIFTPGNGESPVRLDRDGHPDGSRRDIILDKCYRNSRPVLVTAHGLGFGIYRKPRPHDNAHPHPTKPNTNGLVQMFDEVDLWQDIGYHTANGALRLGENVTVARSPDTSPEFLEDHSPVEELVQFAVFDDHQSQADWVARQIEHNLQEDELRPDDIMVINPNPISARKHLGVTRSALLSRGISSHLAGVDTAPDEFFQQGSVVCCSVHRAKGNEAAMVYVVNADECEFPGVNLAAIRNSLFAAITRSKAWVRVTGIGSDMQALQTEFEQIKNADFKLRFRYPTVEELQQLRTIHRDMSQDARRKLERSKDAIVGLVEDLQEGRLFIEDFDADQIQALRTVLDVHSEAP